MPRRNARARSNLHAERLIRPEFGARHPIHYDDNVEFFFGDLDTGLSQVLPEHIMIDDRAKPRKRKQFRVYNDPKRVGVSVLERRLSKNYARRQRVKWTAKDVGRIKGDIQDEIIRLELGRNSVIKAKFTSVVRLGDADGNARKLGLILDQASPAAEFLVREHEIVVNGISSSLKRFRYPYDTYVPHWTVARIHRDVGEQHLNEAVEAVQYLLPMTVELKPVHLYSEQDVGLYSNGQV